MVDEVLRVEKVAASSKSLISRVLQEVGRGGNKAAPSRQRELDQLLLLAGRLWDSVESQKRGPAESEAQPIQNEASTAQQSAGGNYIPTRIGTSEPHVLAEDEATLFMPAMSTTSSAEFAQTFDFSQEHMLFLADNLDTDDLPAVLDFDNHGLDEWV